MRVGDRLRSTIDGQLGFAARDEAGKFVVRLDRPAENRLVPYLAEQWVADGDPRLTSMQQARIAYEADASLRAVQGEYSITAWIGLKDAQRQPWLQGPPKDANALRRKLYEAITRVFK